MPLDLRNDFPMNTRSGSVCDVCGCSQRKIDGAYEQIVDLNITIYGEGPMYVCATCWIEGGRMLGMELPPVVEAVRAHARELQVELAHCVAERDAALAALSAMRQLEQVQSAQ